MSWPPVSVVGGLGALVLDIDGVEFNGSAEICHWLMVVVQVPFVGPMISAEFVHDGMFVLSEHLAMKVVHVVDAFCLPYNFLN